MNWIPCIGFAFAFLCHMFGVYLLKVGKVAIANQRVIIINLALSEMLSSCTQCINSVFAINRTRSTFLLFFVATCGLVTRFVMLHLIVDRSMVIYFHLKYHLYFTKKRVKVASLVLWLVSASLSLGFSLVAQYKLSYWKVNIMIMYAYSAADSIIILSSVISYTHLFFVTVKSERNLRGTVRSSRIKILRKYKLPCLIIATYIVFNFTGTVLVVIIFLRPQVNEPMLVMYSVSVSLVIIGTISDCFIYVIFQKDLRQYLFALLTGTKWRHQGTYRFTQPPINSYSQQMSMTTAF